MRFAFVTTEFPTTRPTSGGLSSYVARMSRLLAEAGHEVEVFVSTQGKAESLRYHGCRVQHVPTVTGPVWRLVTGVLRNTGLEHLGMKRAWLAHARAMAQAVAKADAKMENKSLDSVEGQHNEEEHETVSGVMGLPTEGVSEMVDDMMILTMASGL